TKVPPGLVGPLLHESTTLLQSTHGPPSGSGRATLNGFENTPAITTAQKAITASAARVAVTLEPTCPMRRSDHSDADGVGPCDRGQTLNWVGGELTDSSPCRVAEAQRDESRQSGDIHVGGWQYPQPRPQPRLTHAIRSAWLTVTVRR